MSSPLDRITLDPAVMGGKACIKGTRITVSTVMGLLAEGATEPEVLALYPALAPDDLRAAHAYAAWRLAESDADLPLAS